MKCGESNMNHTAEIQDVKEVKGGTLMKVFVPDTFLEVNIERYRQEGKAYASLKLDDGRTIRADQRKRYFATLKDISDYTGHITESLHDYFKFLYRYLHEDISISMSDCTVTQARDMISLLIDFVLNNDIPLSDLGMNRVDDVDRYLYLCIVNRICSCCGGKADIHHVDKVGAGRNRNKIDHEGMKVIALCRNHHTEIHTIGEKDFEKKHRVYGMKLDKYAIKKLKL